MWREYYVTALLFLNSVWDWKKREICLISLAASAATGAIGNIWESGAVTWKAAGDLGIGAGLLLVSFFSRGAIGPGDGWLFCATGLLLGAADNFALLWMGFGVCAVILSMGMLLGKVHLRDRVPLVPFLFLAQLIRMVL